MRSTFSRHFRMGVAALLAICAVTSSQARADDSLAKWIPPSSNAIAIVHLRAMVNSPLGTKQKWSNKVRQAYTEGLLSAPPSTREVLRATVFGRPSQGPAVMYSIYSMQQQSIIASIAKHEMARGEKIAGKFAVASPRGVLFIQLAPGVLGAVQPPDRSAVLRWVDADHEGLPAGLSPYLKHAIETSDEASVRIAVDLANMPDRTRIRKWLSAHSSLGTNADLDQLASLLSSLRGAQLSVFVTDRLTGRVELDFGARVGSLRESVVAALRQWLDDAGARMQILAAAKATGSENSVVLEAPLDERALRRILNLMQSPNPPAAAGELTGTDFAKPNAVGTSRYYETVFELLKSLDRRTQKSNDYDKSAYWHENAARKIRGLPTAGVDRELLAWGATAEKDLTALAASLRGLPVTVNQIERSVRFDEKTYYRWYATSATDGPLYFPEWVQSSNNVQEARAKLEEAISQNAQQRDSIWRMLIQETAAIAQKMEDRYHIKLPNP